MIDGTLSNTEYKPIINFNRDYPEVLLDNINDKHVQGVDDYNKAVENKPTGEPSRADEFRTERIKLAAENVVAQTPVVETVQLHQMTAQPDVSNAVSAYSEAQSYGEQQVERLVDDILGEMNIEDEKKVEELRQRDALVREHEREHALAAGPYAQGTEFETELGPDGVTYAVGGSVKVNNIAVPDAPPEATKAKMEAIKDAANAPGAPSPQDRTVSGHAAETIQRMDEQIKERTDDIISGTGEASADKVSQNFSVESPMAAFLQAAHAYSQVQEKQPVTNDNNQQQRIKAPEKINIAT